LLIFFFYFFFFFYIVVYVLYFYYYNEDRTKLIIKKKETGFNRSNQYRLTFTDSLFLDYLKSIGFCTNKTTKATVPQDFLFDKDYFVLENLEVTLKLD